MIYKSVWNGSKEGIDTMIKSEIELLLNILDANCVIADQPLFSTTHNFEKWGADDDDQPFLKGSIAPIRTKLKGLYDEIPKATIAAYMLASLRSAIQYQEDATSKLDTFAKENKGKLGLIEKIVAEALKGAKLQ